MAVVGPKAVSAAKFVIRAIPGAPSRTFKTWRSELHHVGRNGVEI